MSYEQRLKNQPLNIQQHMAGTPGHDADAPLDCSACQRAVNARLDAAQAQAQRRVRVDQEAAARRKVWAKRIDRVLMALLLGIFAALAWYTHLHGLSGGR
jgi:hypothetical protein